MAYIALYRKYRPTRFEDVAGQNHIVKTLQNAVVQNRIAHAYLFCGPRGTGKTTIAKIFAKMINCESETSKPCGNCTNCKLVQQGNHPDIIEIDAASNNGVEEVRDLIEKVKYAPINGKYKVYIIDEVHMMSSSAFNALLKTIEEPPAHVLFIFATTEPQKVLPTIISRCQRYDFTKVSINDMLNRIKDILKEENLKYEEEAIRLVCQLADGGMRDALSILDQVIAYSTDEITVEAVNAIYGILTVSEKIEILQLVADKKAKECIEKVQEFIDKGIDIKRTTIDFIDILKETVIHDYSKDCSLLTILNEEEVYRAKIGKTTNERLKMIDELMNTFDKYRFASNINSYFEVCLLNMMSVEVPTVATNVSRETYQPVEMPKKYENKQNYQEIKPIKQNVPEVEEKQFERLLHIEEPREVKKLDKEFVLSLLVGANKSYRNEDSLKFKQLPNYYLNSTWARYANLLREHNLVASGKDYIVVSVSNQPIANEINEQDSQGSFVEFMYVLLLKKKKVFAITEEEQKEIIQEFIQRQKMGTLPQPAAIQVEVNSLELAKNLFGEENIEIKE